MNGMMEKSEEFGSILDKLERRIALIEIALDNIVDRKPNDIYPENLEREGEGIGDRRMVYVEKCPKKDILYLENPDGARVR